jgi:hypothetical protein
MKPEKKSKFALENFRVATLTNADKKFIKGGVFLNDDPNTGTVTVSGRKDCNSSADCRAVFEQPLQ